MLLKDTGKGLFDRNTLYSPIVHRIHGYCYCSQLLILFTVYTIIDRLLLYCYYYRHRIIPVIEITWILIVINNTNKLTVTPDTFTGPWHDYITAT